MKLKLELKKVNEEFIKNAPADIVALFKKETDRIVREGVEASALKLGDMIPAFSLKNALGEVVHSKDLLAQGPLVINFYRGGWCPYCNLELAAYQRLLPELRDLGAQLIAISPELPDNSLTLMEKHELKYEILSDLDNQVAKQFGITFELSPQVRTIYESFGIDLKGTQGNDKHELPIPATYVVNERGQVILQFVNADYTDRLEPEEILGVL